MNDSTKTPKTSDGNEVYIYSKNDGYTLMADLSELGENGSILFFDSTCTVIGLDYIPRALYCSPIFNPSKLPEFIQKNFNDIRVVIFETKLAEDDKKKTFLPIPKWIMGMPSVEYVTFNGVELTRAFFMANLPIKHLIIEEISLTGKKTILRNIDNLKSLQFLVHDNLFSANEVATMARKVNGLVILSESEYDNKLDTGEIPLPDWAKNE